MKTFRTPSQTAVRATSVPIEVSFGELLDKMTILQIKSERIADPAKLQNVRAELESLEAACDRALGRSEGLTELMAELRSVNEALWQIEDTIRECEQAGDFGARFIKLARSVYRTNDRRAALKRTINERLGSRFIEEKAYVPYE